MKFSKSIFIILIFLFGFGGYLTGQITEKKSSSLYKKVKYETSLAYTKWTCANQWWNKIEPYNIYLGALPLKNEGHFELILGLGVTRILSMLESFELEDGWREIPVKAADWQKQGVEVEQIHAVDSCPLKLSEIERGVNYLAMNLEGSHTVYVHCKAGRGRSATIVIAYLMKHQKLSYEEAFHYVKKLRPKIHLSAAQQQAVLDYFAKR
ncbi:MAG: dual specificity protein phosphatase family protein [Parachlamydiaceae bacterium]|nr:dual specificity protein phosphatase family protein [Parachlamydiaceae bacterium]